MVARYVPDSGDIIKIDFDPRVGHEQGGWRPALVLSPKLYNEKTGLAVVVPITNQAKGYTFEVPLPSEMKTTGVVLADAVKNVDRIICRRCEIRRDRQLCLIDTPV